MSLDHELRTVLTDEAETVMPPVPDVDGMIRGGQARRRRRSVARAGTAALAAVLVAGGVYGVAQVEREDTGGGIATPPSSVPEAAPPPYPADGSVLAPGTYRKTVGIDETGQSVHADLTFDSEGWDASDQPVKGPDDDSGPYVGVAVLEVQRLPGASGCIGIDGPVDLSGFDPAPTTVDALAERLAALPDSVVLQSVTSRSAFGHDARHLRLRVDTSGCLGSEAYVLADGPTGPVGISYGPTRRMAVDLTVVDVDGTPIVVALWNNMNAPWRLVDEGSRLRSSIRFVS